MMAWVWLLGLVKWQNVQMTRVTNLRWQRGKECFDWTDSCCRGYLMEYTNDICVDYRILHDTEGAGALCVGGSHSDEFGPVCN